MSTLSGSPSRVVLVGNLSPFRCTTSLLVFLSTKAELFTTDSHEPALAKAPVAGMMCLEVASS
jgi:hypothetical protein